MSDKKSIAIVFILCVFTVFFVWMAAKPEPSHTGFDNEGVEVFTGEFQVSIGNGEGFSVILPAKTGANAGEKIVLTTVLSQEQLFGNSMIFYCKQAKVEVFLDGKLMAATEEAVKKPLRMPPGSRWYYWRMPDDSDGKELRIELEYSFDNYAKELPPIYMGTKSAFLYMLVKEAKISILIGISIILLGIMMIFSSFLMKNRKFSRQLCRLGLLAVIISTWMLLESRITQLFTGKLAASAYVLFTFFYMIPVFSLAFLLTYESINRKRHMHILFWLSVSVFGIVMLLELMGIAYFIQMIYAVHILIVMILLGVAACYFEWRKDPGPCKQDESIYMAILFFGAFVGIDILQFYLDSTGRVGTYSKFGIFVFVVYLCYYAVRRVSELYAQEARENLYKELAFKDMMTGLANRSAFEKRMEELRRENPEKKGIVLIADVNNLKYINDTYGHIRGDDAIKSIGYAVKNCFRENCSCFRIGGDEFCIIATGVNKNNFEESCRKFEQQINEIAKEKEYLLSVAFAFAVMENGDIDDCFKRADQQMYKIKARMKNR